MEDPPDIATWNQAQLRGACRQYGLSAVGLKKDLIARVTAHFEKEQRQKAEREKETEPPAKTIVTTGPLGAAEKRAQRFAQRKRKPPPSFFEDPPLRLFAYAVEINKHRRLEEIGTTSLASSSLFLLIALTPNQMKTHRSQQNRHSHLTITMFTATLAETRMMRLATSRLREEYPRL